LQCFCRQTPNVKPGSRIHSQVIQLILAELLELGISLDDGTDSNAKVTDTAAARLDVRAEAGVVGVRERAAVDVLERLERRVRGGTGGVVGWELVTKCGVAMVYWDGWQESGKASS
jgi:hypothetical protein